MGRNNVSHKREKRQKTTITKVVSETGGRTFCIPTPPFEVCEPFLVRKKSFQILNSHRLQGEVKTCKKKHQLLYLIKFGLKCWSAKPTLLLMWKRETRGENNDEIS